MSLESYHKDHWAEIEAERLERYEQMFIWQPERDAMLDPAQLEAGQTVLDFGCGPGYVALELARRVGPSGQVHGVDLNLLALDTVDPRSVGPWRPHARLARAS